ncbi:MAG: arsenate reductase family protein [Sporolactobacillus sp.]
MLKMYQYPTCGTCRKAKKWLDAHQIAYTEVHIVKNPPTKEELKKLWRCSGLPLKKFFNTSGKHYREQGIKEKISGTDEDQWLDFLAADGMLLKRPILVEENKVTIGFNEETFNRTWNN